MKRYFRNAALFIGGFVWCFTRQCATQVEAEASEGIHYKAGWNPLAFVLLVYWWDYGAACLLCNRGVQSLSRAYKLLGKDHWLSTGPLLWGSIDRKET